MSISTAQSPGAEPPAPARLRLPTALQPMLATWQHLADPVVAGWQAWRALPTPPGTPRQPGLRLQGETADTVVADWVLHLQAWQDPAQLMPLGLRPRLSQAPESGALRQLPQERDPLLPGKVLPQVKVGIQLRF